MVALGLLTGVSYQSGLDYYKQINEKFMALVPKGKLMPPNPTLLMVSVDCDEYAALLVNKDWVAVAKYLSHGVARLVKAEEPDAFSVFILPPSEEALHKRLVDRGRESAEIIERRFSEAKSEISSAYELGIYDAMVTNDDLDRAADELDHLLEARLRRAARSGPATSR